MKLAELLKDSAYKLTQFKPAQIAAFEASITQKDAGKAPALYVNCLVRGKPIKLTPEEAVRQIYVMVLREDLGYRGIGNCSTRRCLQPRNAMGAPG